MLHAVIRSNSGAFHFLGEITPYNIETLRMHVRDRAIGGQPIHVSFNMDVEDPPAFLKHAGRWITALRRRGNAVDVAVTGQPVGYSGLHSAKMSSFANSSLRSCA